MRRRLLNIALLLAVSFSFGGLGQLLHERDAEHASHDHEHCALCQTLAAPRVDRLPGGMICLAVADPPTHAPPADEAAPKHVFVHTPTDARAPPAAPRI